MIATGTFFHLVDNTHNGPWRELTHTATGGSLWSNTCVWLVAGNQWQGLHVLASSSSVGLDQDMTAFDAHV